MKILFLSGLILHIFFLVSIFYIYFQSPILKGIHPQNDLLHAPARRLVLFSCDGLRAESFLQGGANRTPFIQEIVLNDGILGISHTRVPTESRPGHVALIAGFYEDPSAVFRGWKENPVEFDSIFNRSQLTYSWGSPDILPMFAKGATPGKVFTSSYDPTDEDFSRGTRTELLDIWVFDRVKQFLSDPGVVERLRKHDRLIFFLHLLGMDTAGHVYKPHSAEFTKNLEIVDEGIRNTVALIERVFENDEKTAYIFTSDHGMTDRGSHGAGEPHETETPIVAWGAGVSHGLERSPASSQNQLWIKNTPVSRFDIDQADVVALMAGLLGVAGPINSLGKLPTEYLNVTEKYLAMATKNNAFQILAQYEKWHEQSERKPIGWFKSTKEVHYQQDLKQLVIDVKTRLHQQKFKETTEASKRIISTALEAIDYYQTYYKFELLVSNTLVMLGWIVLLIFELTSNRAVSVTQKHRKRIGMIVGVLTTVIVCFNLLQHTPAVATCYFTLPVFVWGVVAVYTLEKLGSRQVSILLTNVGVYVMGAAVLVWTFFDRRVLSVLLMANCVYLICMTPADRWSKTMWLVSSAGLAVFPMLPIIQKNAENPLMLACGTVMWMLFAGQNFLSQPKLLHAYLLCGLSLTSGLYFLIVIVTFVGHFQYTLSMQIFSWVVSCIAMVLPIYGPPSVLYRITTMAICFSIPYTMMSLSYESLFFLFYFVNLVHWLRMELAAESHAKETPVKTYLVTRRTDRTGILWSLFGCCLRNSPLATTNFERANLVRVGMLNSDGRSMAANENSNWLRFLASQNEVLEQIFYTQTVNCKRSLTAADVRRTFLFMLYLFISFFGTGNMASISSFDPNWVRCYVTTFSPFLMAALIVLKLMLPLFVLVCVLKALHIITKVSISKLLISVLIVCDTMCLGFLYLVKNKGSWLDIGTSISHFIIMECTILVLTLIYGLASLYTSFDFFAKRTYVNVLPVNYRKEKHLLD